MAAATSSVAPGTRATTTTSCRILANFISKPDRVYGLEFGGSFLADTISSTGGVKVPEQIVSAHVAYSKETPEFIAETASVRHDVPGVGLLWSHAYYIQGAYRLPWDGRKWKPYYRFEHIGIPAGDIAFATVPQLDGSTIGLRYDIALYAALKVEYRTWTRGPGSTRDSGGFFQLSFTF
jgi:hypothetical protein